MVAVSTNRFVDRPVWTEAASCLHTFHTDRNHRPVRNAPRLPSNFAGVVYHWITSGDELWRCHTRACHSAQETARPGSLSAQGFDPYSAPFRSVRLLLVMLRPVRACCTFLLPRSCKHQLARRALPRHPGSMRQRHAVSRTFHSKALRRHTRRTPGSGTPIQGIG